MLKTLGKDCCNQDIVPKSPSVRLSVHRNRHPNCDGTSWGWIDGCTLNICWSNNKGFNEKAARELANGWNANLAKGAE